MAVFENQALIQNQPGQFPRMRVITLDSIPQFQAHSFYLRHHFEEDQSRHLKNDSLPMIRTIEFKSKKSKPTS